MNKNEIIFKLNDTEKIVVELEEELRNIDCCSEAPIVFLQDSKKVTLSKDSVRENMTILSNLLREALSNELQLHKSITEDIGYVYNQYSDFLWNKKSKAPNSFGYTQLEGRDIWAGNKYNVWNSALTSWIYNDIDGSIIFELTPMYPEDFFYTKKKPQKISYQEWIKGYAPYLIEKIPYNVAQKWLTQANAILEQIDENIKRFIKEAEEDNDDSNSEASA